jgi:hypothetical protein
MFNKLFVSASFAALLIATPAIAQESQGQGSGGQGGQIPIQNQEAQPQGGNAGQGTEAQQQPSQPEATGDQGQMNNRQENAGQATGEQPAAQDQAAGQGQADQTKKQDNAQQNRQDDQQLNTGTTGKAASDVPAEQRTIIRERIISRNVPRIERDRVDFDINVGVAVPGTIQLQPLPPDIVEIVPVYRGYNYFVLADGTIIIVDPGTSQIVYVLAG